VETTVERFSRGGGRMTRPVLVVRGGGAVAVVDVGEQSTGVCMEAAGRGGAAAGGGRGLPGLLDAAGVLAGAERGGLDSKASVKRKSRRREDCNGVATGGVAI
jgi:hypothetical protein